MSTAIVNRETTAVPDTTPRAASIMTPAEMLSLAIERGSGLDMVSKLMDLQERWEKSEAQKAFRSAFSAFKAEAISVVRNKTITDGPLKGKSYAELFAFVDAVTPALSKHNLSHSWAITRDDKDWIEVTCTIEHVYGDKKQVSMGGPPDVGGAKNQIQARASTVKYLERYTLQAACGLAEKNDDNDGAGGGNDTIDDDEAQNLRDMIDASRADETRFLKYMGVSDITLIRSKDYDRAVAALQKKAGGK